MSTILGVLLGLGMGLFFGVSLEKSKVYNPYTIFEQLLLKNFTMIKMFLTAILTGLFVFIILSSMGWISLSPKTTWYAADILGGLLMGLGMAMTAACPGTAPAQLAVGYKDALFTVMGLLVGAGIYTLLTPFMDPIFRTELPGKLTFDQVLGIPFGLLGSIVFGLGVLFLLWLEKKRPWKTEMANIEIK